MADFQTYRPRNISFYKVAQVQDWKVKVYTITKNKSFHSWASLDKAINSIDKWTEEVEKSDLPNYKVGFLIAHEAREGIWIFFSWWTGGEMIDTIASFASYGDDADIEPNPYSNSLICVWELEVFLFERKAWISHILMKAEHPDMEAYLKDHIVVTT